jgi:hypothetical protein
MKIIRVEENLTMRNIVGGPWLSDGTNIVTDLATTKALDFSALRSITHEYMKSL